MRDIAYLFREAGANNLLIDNPAEWHRPHGERIGDNEPRSAMKITAVQDSRDRT